MKKNKQFFTVMPMLTFGLLFFLAVSIIGCAGRAEIEAISQNPADETTEPINPGQAGNSRVYFTTDISPSGLMAAYNGRPAALGIGSKTYELIRL